MKQRKFRAKVVPVAAAADDDDDDEGPLIVVGATAAAMQRERIKQERSAAKAAPVASTTVEVSSRPQPSQPLARRTGLLSFGEDAAGPAITLSTGSKKTMRSVTTQQARQPEAPAQSSTQQSAPGVETVTDRSDANCSYGYTMTRAYLALFQPSDCMP